MTHKGTALQTESRKFKLRRNSSLNCLEERQLLQNKMQKEQLSEDSNFEEIFYPPATLLGDKSRGDFSDKE